LGWLRSNLPGIPVLSYASMKGLKPRPQGGAGNPEPVSKDKIFQQFPIFALSALPAEIVLYAFVPPL